MRISASKSKTVAPSRNKGVQSRLEVEDFKRVEGVFTTLVHDGLWKQQSVSPDGHQGLRRRGSVSGGFRWAEREEEAQEQLVLSRTPPGPAAAAEDRRRRLQDKVVRYKFDPRVTARYDVQALIGRGSFSRVVRVQHRTTRQPFAIKMMEVEAPEGQEVCGAELAVLRRVSHANVIQLIEVFQFPRRVYMVLELATGGELLDRIVSRGRFTEQDATRALRMVLAGLGYLHSLGITHRDLKPENLLYYHPGADSRLLVTDFGLATFGGTEPGEDPLRTTCGTPEYLAPEVLLRKPYSCAVDMWALGVIAFVVLSGSMPFEDDSRARLYRSIVRGKYGFHGDPWSSVSNLAKDFIQRLLQSDPDSRLSAGRALAHPWVVTMAGGSPVRNLHRSISRNLKQRASRGSSRCQSGARSSSEHRRRSGRGAEARSAS
ncbi:LOW QUALITY PROTEIN: serine/threonine-protein kinase H2-like [Synchiropus splendidus]|uniref:LOW QUALITY PROTEIN: serine/threonine-protein kinase H2-like n=1 Tax=Synchiropus splendidus TaxID=270530 RepID=UPI00237EA57D|nr:LOW QUALITY PROTEIN: serine/threonine-protein kinase H2-like [Synchiropus splendidus]